jgi:hypothetical protein
VPAASPAKRHLRSSQHKGSFSQNGEQPVLAIPLELQNIDVIDRVSDLILTVALKGADYQTVNAITDLIASGHATLAIS